MYDPDMFDLFNPLQRELTAKALARDGGVLPEVLCLQEVESLIALRAFNERHLGDHYKRALLVDSRDFRQIDVGVLTNLDKTEASAQSSLTSNKLTTTPARSTLTSASRVSRGRP
jgi:hypothetical protein